MNLIQIIFFKRIMTYLTFLIYRIFSFTPHLSHDPSMNGQVNGLMSRGNIFICMRFHHYTIFAHFEFVTATRLLNQICHDLSLKHTNLECSEFEKKKSCRRGWIRWEDKIMRLEWLCGWDRVLDDCWKRRILFR